jgi:tetratricopeptide (TPR) repeat protein
MNREHSDNADIRRFEEQFRLNPDGLVFARLADAYRRAGDPGRALEVLEEGISRHRDYATAHIVRARAYIDLDKSGDAEQAFLRVLELDGSNLVAMRGLAALARHRGDLAGARIWLERISGLDVGTAVERVTPEAGATETVGEQAGSSRSGMDPLPPTEEEWWTPDAEAVAGPEEAQAGPEGPAGAWWFEDPADDAASEDGDLLTRTMAELYEKQGLIEEAAAIYRELLDDHPDDEELRACLARLETRLETASPPPKDIGPPAERRAVEPREPPAGAPVTSVPPGGPSGSSEVFLEWLRGLGK